MIQQKLAREARWHDQAVAKAGFARRLAADRVLSHQRLLLEDRIGEDREIGAGLQDRFRAERHGALNPCARRHDLRVAILDAATRGRRLTTTSSAAAPASARSRRIGVVPGREQDEIVRMSALGQPQHMRRDTGITGPCTTICSWPRPPSAPAAAPRSTPPTTRRARADASAKIALAGSGEKSPIARICSRISGHDDE